MSILFYFSYFLNVLSIESGTSGPMAFKRKCICFSTVKAKSQLPDGQLAFTIEQTYTLLKLRNGGDILNLILFLARHSAAIAGADDLLGDDGTVISAAYDCRTTL